MTFRKGETLYQRINGGAYIKVGEDSIEKIWRLPIGAEKTTADFDLAYSKAIRRLTVPVDLISPQDIINAVCQVAGISKEELKSKTRKWDIVKWRHLAAYCMVNIAHASKVHAGAMLGGRDHATAINSIKKFENMLRYDNWAILSLAKIKTLCQKG